MAQQVFRGGGALAGSVMLAVWLWLSSSGGATASAAARVALTASPRHDHSRASVDRAQWRSRAADRLRAVCRRVVESSGGATASAVARAAWAAPPRHAHSRASVGRARGRSRVAERSRAVRRRVVDGFQAVGSGVAPAVARAASASSPRRARLGSSAGCATHSPVANDCAISCCRAVADGAERVRVVGEGALPSSLGTAPDVRVRVEPLVAVRAAMQASEAARATPVKGVAAVAGSVRTPVWDVLLWSTGWQMYVNRVTCAACVGWPVMPRVRVPCVHVAPSVAVGVRHARVVCRCGCLLLGVCETFQRVSQRG